MKQVNRALCMLLNAAHDVSGSMLLPSSRTMFAGLIRSYWVRQ